MVEAWGGGAGEETCSNAYIYMHTFNTLDVFLYIAIQYMHLIQEYLTILVLSEI